MKRASILLAACAIAMACEENPIRSPTAPRSPPVQPPGPTFVVFGMVRDEKGLAVSGAMADITDGEYAGRTAASNANGYFSFAGVSGQMTVRVYKDGYDRYLQTLNVATDVALEVRLFTLEQADSIRLGRTIQSSVATGATPCDPIRWDARAPCRRFLFTAPSSGSLVIQISWSGGPELDATIVTPENQYLATSDPFGVGELIVAAAVEAGRTYEIRVNSYYSGQVFKLRADLEAPIHQ